MRALDPGAGVKALLDDGVRMSFGHVLRRAAGFAKRQVGIRFNQLEALLFDLRHGTNTRGNTPASEMGLSSEAADHATGYQAVNEQHFRSVMNACSFAPGSTFVDIGSGKGKALLLASRAPSMKRIVGIELSKTLCEIATRNIGKFNRRAPDAAPIEVVHGDAIQSPIDPDQNVFFLFNPFDLEFLRLFLQRIDDSLRSHPRRVWLLYVNPQCRDLIEDEYKYSLIREHRFFGPGRNITVYRKDVAH